MKFVLLAAVFYNSVVACALCVTKNTAVLRAGPGYKFPVTWRAGRFTPLLELSSSGAWYKVQDMDGITQWVRRRDVTHNIECVSVRVTSAVLRTGPNSTAQLADIREVDRYTPFERLDESGNWYKVQASWGDTYWIREDAVWRPLKIARVSF